MDISLIRITAAAAGIYEIGQKKDQLILYSDALRADRLRPVLAQMGGRVTLNAVHKPYLAVRVAPGEKPLDLLRMTLECLGQAAAPPPAEA